MLLLLSHHFSPSKNRILKNAVLQLVVRVAGAKGVATASTPHPLASSLLYVPAPVLSPPAPSFLYPLPMPYHLLLSFLPIPCLFCIFISHLPAH